MQYLQYVIKCNILSYVRIVEYHSDILWTIGADMIPKQKYRLFIMMHRDARFRKFRMEKRPQVVKILPELYEAIK